MTHDFNWQQFLLAAFLLTTIWEAVIILLFFRKDLRNHFTMKRKVRPPARRWIPEPIKKAPEEDQPEDLMGKPAEEEGVISCGMEDIRFAGRSDDQTTTLGLIADALEELKGIFLILREKKGTKHDFFSMIGMLKAKYPAIRESRNLAAINKLIREKLPFELTEEEFNHLWD